MRKVLSFLLLVLAVFVAFAADDTTPASTDLTYTAGNNCSVKLEYIAGG